MTLALFVHLRKDIYSDHAEKPAEWPNVRTIRVSINGQPKRKTSWQNACAQD